MLHKPDIDAIEARAKALNLSLGAIARDAGFAASTPHRWKGNVSPITSTVERMVQALERRELAMLEHLLALHRPAKREASA